jgi:hypothetical protein
MLISMCTFGMLYLECFDLTNRLGAKTPSGRRNQIVIRVQRSMHRGIRVVGL